MSLERALIPGGGDVLKTKVTTCHKDAEASLKIIKITYLQELHILQPIPIVNN